MVLRTFKIALRLRDWHVFICGNFECFQYFNFETDFLENETFFKKLEYRFLVESTKTENTSFPYKSAISKVNVKTNRMINTKNEVLPVATLFSRKFCFILRTFYKELFYIPMTQMPIFIPFASAGVLFDSDFSL